MNYPKKRKSPYKHRVHEHKRLGKTIDSYMRGKGDKPYQPKRPFHRKLVGNIGVYSVAINYGDYGSESLDVKARSYPSALDLGIENRQYFKEPIRISLRRQND